MMKYLLTIFLWLHHALTAGQNAEPGFYSSSGFLGCVSDNLNTQLTTCSLHAGYAFGEFIGIKENYGELGLFIAPNPIYDLQPLIDLKGYCFEDSHWGFSGGFGVRRWNTCSTYVLGANLFYDSRKIHEETFGRVGVGLELFTSWLNYRFNVYIPTKDSTESRYHSLNFSANRDPLKHPGDLHATLYRKVLSFHGVDFEVERNLWEWCAYDITLMGALGTYYYNNKETDSIFGGQARLELDWSQYLSLECRMSYDNAFDFNVQGRVIINIPLFDLLCGRVDDCWAEQITQPIKRQGVIFSQDKYHEEHNY